MSTTRTEKPRRTLYVKVHNRRRDALFSTFRFGPFHSIREAEHVAAQLRHDARSGKRVRSVTVSVTEKP